MVQMYLHTYETNRQHIIEGWVYTCILRVFWCYPGYIHVHIHVYSTVCVNLGIYIHVVLFVLTWV